MVTANVQQVSIRSAVAGLFVGSVAGAFLVSSFAVIEGVVSSEFKIAPDLAMGIGIAVYAFVVWAAGLFILAPLPWYVLHRSGYRGFLPAMIFGFVAASVTVAAALTRGFGLIPQDPFSVWDSGGATWIDGKQTLHGWTETFKAALLCGLCGAVVGLIVWRIAYRRTRA
jgi:hypothetical protein